MRYYTADYPLYSLLCPDWVNPYRLRDALLQPPGHGRILAQIRALYPDPTLTDSLRSDGYGVAVACDDTSTIRLRAIWRRDPADRGQDLWIWGFVDLEHAGLLAARLSLLGYEETTIYPPR